MLHQSILHSLKFSSKMSRLNDRIKRSFDIFVSLVVLGLLAPVFGLIALAVKHDSPGPVIYRGLRAGLGGKNFRILKFRTMYEAPETYLGPRVTAHDDPRLTTIGRWLRDTKLNELPQFWNVLRGEMSLVGPRPEDPEIVRTWPREVRREVLSMRPGITSPASVQYRNEESLLSAGNVMQKYIQELEPDKLRLDQLYVRYRSFWLDLDILLWTALVLLPKVGSHTPPERLLFVGPVTRLIRRYISWFTIDLLITFAAIAFTGLVRRASGPLNVGWPRAILAGSAFALLFSLMGTIFGVNRITWSQAAYSDMYDLLPGWVVATVTAFFVNQFVGFWPSGMILMAAALALGGFVTVRYRSRLLTGFLSRVMRDWESVKLTRERVLIVGSGPTAQLASWLLAHPQNAHRFWVVGFIDNDLFKQGMRIYGSEVVGACKDIPQLIEKHDIGVIVLADHKLASEEYPAIIDQCKRASARVVALPDIFSVLNGMVSAAPNFLYHGKDGKECTDPVCLHCLARLALLDQAAGLEMAGSPDEVGSLLAAD